MADEQASSDAEERDDETDGQHDETSENHDPSVPQVELALYQLNVKVSGQATDELADVEESAIRLMDYLIEQTGTLEDKPDGRGLG
ncbi:hypothetical protein SAMN04487950_3935 [Halogranum rubrum]|uniref:Uncharacterized protein n=2 Tax=Halogranum rubrum TaxID=553466 RepID=A0A1I4I3S2_9EURY|nr:MULTISPECIES: hypothetical protein [Halogranum]EJN61126.1 hypothetical protein HSB1_01670 [Halogranum salarium B-1]SFL48820.1 hypothetical protein SAMN04487950_3935 [Halogranum rubrum]